MIQKLIYIEEPNMSFGANQKAKSPHAGLMLYGPYEGKPDRHFVCGVIGTKEGITLYKSFVERLQYPIYSGEKHEDKRPSYPGFETVFNVKWSPVPNAEIIVDSVKLDNNINEPILKKRTKIIADLYLNSIEKYLRDNEDSSPDIWIIVLPKNVWLNCRDKSKNSKEEQKQIGKDLKNVMQTDLFEENDLNTILEKKNLLEEIIEADSDFHHHFKAQIIKRKMRVPTQIILEPTLQFKDKYKGLDYEDYMKAHIAWTKSTTLYYKLFGIPWKLADIRKGVCYLGFVFKEVSSGGQKKGYACSAAQMFLDSGDGSVFRGNSGKWYDEEKREYHLDLDSSKELISTALQDYHHKVGTYPDQLFIHGRARFSDDEYSGFLSALEDAKAINTKIICITIKSTKEIKLYRFIDNKVAKYGNLRGLALIIDDKKGHLWTNGFIPEIGTSSSLEIPNSLSVQIQKGQADIKDVLTDILALTKLNYNACIYGDGVPVTIKFSDKIGNILAALLSNKGNTSMDQRQFKYYI